MKFVYTFESFEEIEKEEPVIKMIDGQETKVLEKVKTRVPHKFAIKRLGRSESDDYRINLSKYIGIYLDPPYNLKSRMALEHTLRNQGVMGMSNDENQMLKEITEEILELTKKQKEILGDITEEAFLAKEDTSPEHLEKIAKYNEYQEAVRAALFEYKNIEDNKYAIFDNTAEAYAREKMTFWLLFKRAYMEKDGKFIPLFKDQMLEEQVKEFDNIFEDETTPAYLRNAVTRLWCLITANHNRVIEDTPEQYKIMDEESSKNL